MSLAGSMLMAALSVAGFFSILWLTNRLSDVRAEAVRWRRLWEMESAHAHDLRKAAVEAAGALAALKSAAAQANEWRVLAERWKGHAFKLKAYIQEQGLVPSDPEILQ